MLPQPSALFVELETHTDERGILSVADFSKLPFTPKRLFYVYDANGLRGGHAHKKCEQILICLHGSCLVTINDVVYRLSSPDIGLYIKTHAMSTQSFDKDTVLLVLASEPYDPDDYEV